MAEETTVDTTTATTTAPSNARTTSLLDSLGISADEVLSAPNIEATLTSTTTTPTDVLGIFTQQEDLAGVSQLKEAYQQRLQDYLSAQNLANQQQLTIEGRAKKLGVLRGEQAQAATQAQQELQTLQTGLTLAESALTSAQNTAAQRANILYQEYQTKQQLLLQYPGLKINPFTDSMEKVASALDKYQEEQKKDAYKDALKQQLLALGKSVKGLSTNELEKKLKKYNKAALKQAEEEANLRLDGLKLDLANTRDLIANRNKEETSKVYTEQDISTYAQGVINGYLNITNIPREIQLEVSQLLNEKNYTRHSSDEESAF